jgi:calcineurin-like phosphoesterase family protein
MSKIWFTADTHFGHQNIIEYCVRPYRTSSEMDVTLIANWNAVVHPSDTVYHLGDFCWRVHSPELLLNGLNGIKHLIWGNHDDEATIQARGWASSSPISEIVVDGQRITLCHYAMRSWNRSHRGAIMLHGHNHGKLPGNSQSLDVGVDEWDFRPVSLREIRSRLKTLPDRLEVHS